MISKYIITNSWTQAWHGHAHDELSSIKQLLSKWSIDTCILSVDSKFGDRHIPSFGLTLQRLRLDHSRILKTSVDSLRLRDLAKGITKSIAKYPHDGLRVAITSSRTKHLFFVENALRGQHCVRFRFLDSPESSEEWEEFALSVERLNKRVPIAMEVKSSVEESRKYIDNVIHVPSHHGILKETNEINSNRHRIGVFWPVGRSFSNQEVENLLDQVESLNPIVKLPNGLNPGQLRQKYPGIEFLETGLSDKDFRSHLIKIKIAVLGHKDYRNQSSGYVGYFLANNVPILVSRSNSFFDEIRNLGQVYAIEDFSSDIVDLLQFLLNRDLDLTSNVYTEYVKIAWETFLLKESS